MGCFNSSTALGASYIGKPRLLFTSAIYAVCTLKPYLAQIARNQTRNRLREKHKQIVLEEESVLDFICVDEYFGEKEQIEKIRELLNELNAVEQHLMLAYYFYGFKLNEIANTMQLPISTVKSKLYRGRDKLITKFKEGGVTHEKSKSV